MSSWELLGITATSNKRAIKKAYATQLKQIDQEREPERFVALRQALEDALEQADYLDEEQTETTETRINTQQLQEKLSTIDSNLSIEVRHVEQAEFEKILISEQFYNSTTDYHYNNDKTQEHYQHEPIEILPHDDDIQYVQEKFNLSTNVVDLLEQSPLVFDNQTELEDHHYIYYTHYNTEIHQLLNHSLHFLYTEQFNDESLQYFLNVLDYIKTQPLIEQIELKNNISHALNQVYHAEDNPDFAKFILAWDNYFPDPECLFEQENEQLYAYIRHFKQQQTFYQFLPESLKKYFNRLSENKGLNLYSVFRIYFYLKKQNKDIVSILDNSVIRQREQNKTYLYLVSLANLFRETGLNIILIIFSFYYAKNVLFYNVAFTPVQRILLIAGVALFALTWVVLIQNYIKVTILTRENNQQWQTGLHYIWLFWGIIAFSCFYFIEQVTVLLINPHIAFIWLLLNNLVFSILFIEHRHINRIFSSVNNLITDIVIVGFILFGLIKIPFSISNLRFELSPWYVIYSFIPVGLIFYHQAFRDVFRKLGFSKQYYVVSRQQLKYFVQDYSAFALKIAMIYTVIHFFVPIPYQANAFAGLIMLSYLMFSVYSTEQLSYLFKYVGYASLLVYTFNQGFLFILMSFFSIFALVLDYKRWKAYQQQNT